MPIRPFYRDPEDRDHTASPLPSPYDPQHAQHIAAYYRERESKAVFGSDRLFFRRMAALWNMESQPRSWLDNLQGLWDQQSKTAPLGDFHGAHS